MVCVTGGIKCFVVQNLQAQRVFDPWQKKEFPTKPGQNYYKTKEHNDNGKYCQ